MKMMKKGNDTQYVPDVFVESFKKNGFEICGENTGIAEPAKAPVNAPVNPSDNSDNNSVHICPYCDKEYAREGDLKNHIEKKHPAE